MVLGCVGLQLLMVSGLVTYERHANSLQQALLNTVREIPAVGSSIEEKQQALVEQFLAFLPKIDEVERMSSALHTAAAEAGVDIDKLSSQPSGSQANVFQRHALRLPAKPAGVGRGC